MLSTREWQAEERDKLDEPEDEPSPEECKACKQTKAVKEWKERHDAYIKGEGRDPGKSPAKVNRRHILNCPGYKQKGCGPARKDDRQQQQVGASYFLSLVQLAHCSLKNSTVWK